MTPAQYLEAKAQVVAADTEAAALDQQVRDCIEKAREWNLARRVASDKRAALTKAIEPVRESVAAYEAEQRRKKAEEEIEKQRKKAEEEAAAKAKEKTELDQAKAEIETLKAALAAKDEEAPAP